MQAANPISSPRKLDFVTDSSGYISMLIYNSHPAGGLLIAPKYFPDPAGTWASRSTGQRYNRFEYYWNVKNQPKGNQARVYEVDKNPLHDYATDVVGRFNQHLVADPCHGVPMFLLPRESVVQYWDAMKMYRAVQEHVPLHMNQFIPFIKKMRDVFAPEQVGITGSYLYDLYQDFSDINFVIYDEAVEVFHDMLVAENALLDHQDIEVTLPAPGWPGWLHGEFDASTVLPPAITQKAGKTIISVKNRFIGAIHDAMNERTRAGFWISNTVDPYPHGTFTKTKRGIAVVKGRVTSWTEGLSSGHLRLDGVEILGIHPEIAMAQEKKWDRNDTASMEELARRVNISAVQVIGEFNRMFLGNEEVVAYGLVEEIKVRGKKEPIHELLVGGREMGGWIFPRNDASG